MGQLIRAFLEKRRQRKFWRRRLEPVLDRMMEEREREEEPAGEWIDLNELGNRVDEMTERPTRPGEQRAMQSAGEEIALEADPVSMAGGSGASLSEDQAASGKSSVSSELEEQGERPQREVEGTEPFFPSEPVSMEEILDRLLQERERSGAGSRKTTRTITQVENAHLMSEGLRLQIGKREDDRFPNGAREDFHLLNGTHEDFRLLNGAREDFHLPNGTHEDFRLPNGAREDFHLLNGTHEDFHLPNCALEDLLDQEVDALKQEFRRLVREHAAGRLLQVTQTRAPRRKHIDPRGTVRRMTRAGGAFNGFAYRPSPSESPNRVDAQHLLVIADVSGSMGRYVGTVLYLLSCLEELATVDSYIFSDATTYASDLLGTGDFHEQFTRLKEGAASWEYGTRLSQALADVVRDRRFHARTRVVLLTDGGFSLIGTDWPDTVRGLLALHQAVERIHLITPNLQLIEEGPACADSLWNVENAPRAGHDLLDPDRQKTARYGLLTRYSANSALCQTPADLLHVLQALLA